MVGTDVQLFSSRGDTRQGFTREPSNKRSFPRQDQTFPTSRSGAELAWQRKEDRLQAARHLRLGPLP